MQNGWGTGKKQGQPLSGIALIPFIYIVAAKNRNHTC